jgi:hypothetical protein
MASGSAPGQAVFIDPFEQSRQGPAHVCGAQEATRSRRLVVLGTDDAAHLAFEIGNTRHRGAEHVASNSRNRHNYSNRTRRISVS